MEHLDPDQIVLLALGEPDDRAGLTAGGRVTGEFTGPDVAGHLETCDICRYDLTQLSRTVELARGASDLGLQTPLLLPPSIWSGIADELGIGSCPTSAGSSIPGQRLEPPVYRPAETSGRRQLHPPAPSVHRHSWRRALVAAAAIVIVGGSVTAGVAIGRHGPAVSAVQSEAALTPMPTGPSTAHGLATVTQGAAGLMLSVTARQLPLRQGYFEVWLYDPTANQMVAVGTLGAGGDGAWTLASTIDLRSYSVVDVSAQDFDGNPAHKDSMLRGTLTH